MQSPDGVKAIAVAGVHASYPGGWGLRGRRPAVEALRGVDLHVERGEIFGLLGPNGSGKSTLLRILAGLALQDRGEVHILGDDPTPRPLAPRVGFLPEGRPPFPWLKGRTQLRTLGELQGMARKAAQAAADAWLDRLGLTGAAQRRVSTYSTGMAQRLGLAGALMTGPEVLLLDEPTSGLDPLGSELIMEVLSEQARSGVAVLLASHHLQEVEGLCRRVAVLVGGRIRAAGALDDLLGTGGEALVARGMDDRGWQQVLEAVAAAGGEVVERRPERRHLFALFRDAALQDAAPSTPDPEA